MYHELRQLGIFEGPEEYLVTAQLAERTPTFKVDVRLASKMIHISLPSPSQIADSIAVLSPAGLDVNDGYPRDVIEKVLSEVRTRLISKSTLRSTVSLALPRYVVSKEHSELSDQLSPEAMMWVLAKRGIFEAKLPDILVGQLVVRMDHSDPTDVIFRLGQLQQPELHGLLEARWFMNYHQNGKYEIYPGSMERVSFNQTLKDALHRYNDVINGLMVNADNGLLV